MSFFEFVMVLVGLVGAIALSTILSYLGHLIRNWAHVNNPILFLTLVVWMIFNVIGHIAGIWAYRSVDLGIHNSVFAIVAPILFFTLAAATLIPTIVEDGSPIDLNDVYFATSRPVFLLLALHEASALATDYLPGVLDAPPALFMLSMVAIFIAGTATKRHSVHYALLALLLLSQALPPILQVVTG